MSEPADPDTERQLRMLISRVLNLREDRRSITADIAEVLKESRSRGFDSRKITEVCIWLEKVEKNGRDEMLEAEELFRIYRDVAEGPTRPLAEEFAEVRDKVLVEIFASPPEPKAPPKRLKSLNAHRAAAEMAQRALRGDI